MLTKNLLYLSGLLFLLGQCLPIRAQGSQSDFIQNIIIQKNIEVVEGKSWEIDYPSRAKQDPLYQHTDLSYWVQDVLPYDSDRDQDAYLVYPKMGIIVPILGLNNTDKRLILNKKPFDHFKYLQEGALHYVGYSPTQGIGNMVIAGHSAYMNDDPGRYKTAFQSVIFSDIGDTIRYFERQEDSSFTRYEYQITESKQIKTSDTSILFPTKPIKQLTTYTCYPIGTSDERWYNKADFISEKTGFNSKKSQKRSEDDVLGGQSKTQGHEDINTISIEGLTKSNQEEGEAPIHNSAPKRILDVPSKDKSNELSVHVSNKSIVSDAVQIATQIATNNYYRSYSMLSNIKRNI